MICKPQAAIAHSLRTRINQALKNNTKSGSLIELLGCSIGDFKIYLENMFDSEMTWLNNGDWHIDHRRPCASFDLENREQLLMCFHYTNLQPMWATNNLSKGKFYDEESFDWEWDGSKWIEKV